MTLPKIPDNILTKDNAVDLLGGLIRVKNGPVKEGVGICGAVYDALADVSNWFDLDLVLERLFNLWPHFSGYDVYPIPITLQNKSQDDAMYAYENARDSGKLWDETTEYGRLRWAALNFLIEILEEYLKDEK